MEGLPEDDEKAVILGKEDCAQKGAPVSTSTK
jgi:hypothetical protein